MGLGAWVLLAAVVLAAAIGSWRLLTDGHFRGTHQVRGAATSAAEEPAAPPSESVLHGTPWEAELGPRATLLQFSSAFCAPCRVTRRVLADVATSEQGVVHLEVDAEHHLDVVRRLGILRTPTTLVLDAAGREVGRAQGAPRPEQVRAALAGLPA